MTRLLPALALCAAACTPAVATEIGGEWTLVGLDGSRPSAAATIVFATDGTVSGKAPCNRYFGSYGGDLPEIALSPLGATKMACEALEAESAYFAALQAVTHAEVADEHLFLIGPEGRVLEFARDPDDQSCITCGD